MSFLPELVHFYGFKYLCYCQVLPIAQMLNGAVSTTGKSANHVVRVLHNFAKIYKDPWENNKKSHGSLKALAKKPSSKPCSSEKDGRDTELFSVMSYSVHGIDSGGGGGGGVLITKLGVLF